MPETRIRIQDLEATLQSLLARAEPKTNNFAIGGENGINVQLLFKGGASSTTAIRYNSTSNKFELSHDGTTFSQIVTTNHVNFHAQNTDTGTSLNEFAIGNGVDGNKKLFFNIGTPSPYLKYDSTIDRVVLSNDGVSEVELGAEKLVFPRLLVNQNGSYQGRIIPAESSISFSDFPTEFALNPQKNSFVHVQMIVTAPTVQWVNAEGVIEFQQDPTTKKISLVNHTQDAVEVRMFVDPL